MNTVTINNYYINGAKLVGTIGDNNMELIKGRFFSVELTTQLESAAYCAAGIKYVLGTQGKKPLGDVLKGELNKLTFERHTGNVINKAIMIASQITPEQSQPELESTREYKTCTVLNYVWRILGRTINLTVNQSKLNMNTELTIN
jgi:hypothetical protein